MLPDGWIVPMASSGNNTQKSGGEFALCKWLQVSLNTLKINMYRPSFINGELKAHRGLVTCAGHTLNEQQRCKKLERLLWPHLGSFNSSDPLWWVEGLADFKDRWTFGNRAWQWNIEAWIPWVLAIPGCRLSLHFRSVCVSAENKEGWRGAGQAGIGIQKGLRSLKPSKAPSPLHVGTK